MNQYFTKVDVCGQVYDVDYSGYRIPYGWEFEINSITDEQGQDCMSSLTEEAKEIIEKAL